MQWADRHRAGEPWAELSRWFAAYNYDSATAFAARTMSAATSSGRDAGV
jgi:hypothetical protein